MNSINRKSHLLPNGSRSQFKSPFQSLSLYRKPVFPKNENKTLPNSALCSLEENRKSIDSQSSDCQLNQRFDQKVHGNLQASPAKVKPSKIGTSLLINRSTDFHIKGLEVDKESQHDIFIESQKDIGKFLQNQKRKLIRF